MTNPKAAQVMACCHNCDNEAKVLHEVHILLGHANILKAAWVKVGFVLSIDTHNTTVHDAYIYVFILSAAAVIHHSTPDCHNCKIGDEISLSFSSLLPEKSFFIIPFRAVRY